jgi:peptidoglycan/LPS O-acetylase OafA/YrhL
MRVTAVVTTASLVVLAILLANRHTIGEEIWGPVTAAGGVLVGVLSLAYLARRGRSRVARYALYALWLTVAFFGFGGYNDHRLPRPADTITDQRERPPLAPLMFTVWGIAGAVALRSGTKGD